MYEVELKVRAVHEGVRNRLEELGARRLGTVHQEDTYYDAPHRDFAESDEALRIRRESPEAGDPRALLTYKGPLVDEASKTRTEAESVVADDDAVSTALDCLGFAPAATVVKTRERYALEEFTVTLDTVEGLGEFVEIEREVDTEAAVDRTRERAAERLERLGLDPGDGIRTSYLGLCLAGEGTTDGR